MYLRSYNTFSIGLKSQFQVGFFLPFLAFSAGSFLGASSTLAQCTFPHNLPHDLDIPGIHFHQLIRAGAEARLRVDVQGLEAVEGDKLAKMSRKFKGRRRLKTMISPHSPILQCPQSGNGFQHTEQKIQSRLQVGIPWMMGVGSLMDLGTHFHPSTVITVSMLDNIDKNARYIMKCCRVEG